MIIDNRYYQIKSIFGYQLRALVIGCLAVFFLALKLGGTSEKNHPVLFQA